MTKIHKLYWPVITYQDNDKSIRKFSTSLGCKTCGEAKATIRSWAEDFHIRSARVDVYNCSVFPAKKIRTYNLF